jgi:tRNA-2-methylthio-N6-dimethylallyladenosine synthase
MIDAMRRLPKVCRHLHLPVQSGSSRILAAMRRRPHSRGLPGARRARARGHPDIALSTDMIVGFPGETAKDFDATLSLTTEVRYHSMFSFKYSPRPNTLALKRLQDDVEEGEKTRRIVALQGLQRGNSGGLARPGRGLDPGRPGGFAQPAARLGALGRTSGNTVVNFAGRADGSAPRAGRITAANPTA